MPGAARLQHTGPDSGTEQFADHIHPVHQGALDDEEGATELLVGLLGVRVDVVRDAVHEGVLEALRDRRLAPRQVDDALLALALDLLGLSN